MKKILKRHLFLKEDAERNYAADTSGVNDSASKIVNDTKAKHSDAQAVTIPGKEMDGSSETQTTTVDINNDPASLKNAQQMAKVFNSQGQDVNFKVKLNNSLKRSGQLVEGITFTKSELREWLKSI